MAKKQDSTEPTLRERAIDAYDSARSSVSTAGQTVSGNFDKAPLAVLAGGLAVGALAGALMRRTDVEDKLLGPVGGKITGMGKDAIDAARTAGQDKLVELDITRDAGSRLVKSVLDGLGNAAKASGDAAVQSVKIR